MRAFLVPALLVLCLSQGSVATAGAAVIETPILKMSLPGQWEPRPEFAKEVKERFAFYDKANGNLLYLQKLEKAVSPQAMSELVTNMPIAETFWGEAPHPQLARFIATQFFPLPESYHTANGPNIRDAMKSGKTDTLYVWDMKGVEGDAQLYYTSQLIPRIAVAKVNGKLNVGEEYVSLRVARAEKVTVPEGEAVLFDLETERTAVDRAIERFGMPEGLKGQRIRYSWVIYGPSGFAAGPPISALVAASASSPLDSNAILNALRQSGGPR